MRKLLFLTLVCVSFGLGQSTTDVDPWSSSRYFDTLGVNKFTKFGFGGTQTAEGESGLAVMVDTVNLILSNAAVGITSFRTQGFAGLYRVSYFGLTTDTGSVGKAVLKIRYGGDEYGDSTIVDSDSLNLASTTGYIQGSRIVYVNDDNVYGLKYSTAITGTTGSPSYFIGIVLEYLYATTNN